MILVFASRTLDGGAATISPLWLVGAYVLFTFGELCISPIGLSMVSKLSPAKFCCLLMGVWFLTSAFANILAGQLSTLYPDSKFTNTIPAWNTNQQLLIILYDICCDVNNSGCYTFNYQEKVRNHDAWNKMRDYHNRKYIV